MDKCYELWVPSVHIMTRLVILFLITYPYRCIIENVMGLVTGWHSPQSKPRYSQMLRNTCWDGKCSLLNPRSLIRQLTMEHFPCRALIDTPCLNQLYASPCHLDLGRMYHHVQSHKLPFSFEDVNMTGTVQCTTKLNRGSTIRQSLTW